MMNKHLSLTSIDSATSALASVWDAVYETDPFAMPTQSRAWANTIEKGSGSRTVARHYRFSDGQEAVIPLFKRNIVPLAVSILNSPPPAWGYGGALSSLPLTANHLEAILEDCARLPGAAMSIRPNPLLAGSWFAAGSATGWVTEPRTSHILDLEGGFKTVWTSRFSGKARNRVRRAQNQGVTVEIGNDARKVAEFDLLFRRSIDRWARKQSEYRWLARLRGHLRDSSQKFRQMARHAGPLLKIAIARHEDQPVAGAICLLDRNAHYTRGAMDDRLIGKTYANYLLQSTMIELACQHHCRHYHMGETGNSATLAQYKSEFGAVPVDYSEFRRERLPIYSADRTVRSGIKRLIGFSDV